MMELKRLKEKHEVVRILALEDDISSFIKCDRGEWIQILMKYADDPKMNIAGIFREGDLVGYIVLQNMVYPPVSDSVYVVYSHCSVPVSEEGMGPIRDYLLGWTEECGASRLTTVTDRPENLEPLGFVPVEKTIMELAI